MKKRKTSEFFPVIRAWTPPPTPRQTKQKFLDPRMYKRYRGGRESIPFLKTFCVSLSSQSHQRPDVRHIYVHRYVKKLNLNFKVASLLP